YALRASSSAGYFHSNFNSGTGALTTQNLIQNADLLADGGRPFQHYGFLLWPNYTSDFSTLRTMGLMAQAGSTSVFGYGFSTPATINMTAGDKLVTCAVADNPLVNLEVGQILWANYGGG